MLYCVTCENLRVWGKIFSFHLYSHDKSRSGHYGRDLIPKIKIPMERNFTIREFVESGGPQY